MRRTGLVAQYLTKRIPNMDVHPSGCIRWRWHSRGGNNHLRWWVGAGYRRSWQRMDRVERVDRKLWGECPVSTNGDVGRRLFDETGPVTSRQSAWHHGGRRGIRTHRRYLYNISQW